MFDAALRSCCLLFVPAPSNRRQTESQALSVLQDRSYLSLIIFIYFFGYSLLSPHHVSKQSALQNCYHLTESFRPHVSPGLSINPFFAMSLKLAPGYRRTPARRSIQFEQAFIPNTAAFSLFKVFTESALYLVSIFQSFLSIWLHTKKADALNAPAFFDL
jgi:hypothetical protein